MEGEQRGHFGARRCRRRRRTTRLVLPSSPTATALSSAHDAGLPARPQAGRQLRRARLAVGSPALVPPRDARPPGRLCRPRRDRRHALDRRRTAPHQRQGACPALLALVRVDPRRRRAPLSSFVVTTSPLTLPLLSAHVRARRSSRPTSSSRACARASFSSRPSSSSPSSAAWWGCVHPTLSRPASSSLRSMCVPRSPRPAVYPGAELNLPVPDATDPVALSGRRRRDLLLGPAPPGRRDRQAPRLELERQPRPGRQARRRGASPSLARLAAAARDADSQARPPRRATARSSRSTTSSSSTPCASSPSSARPSRSCTPRSSTPTTASSAPPLPVPLLSLSSCTS